MIWNFISAITLVGIGILITFIVAKMASDREAVNKGIEKFKSLYKNKLKKRRQQQRKKQHLKSNDIPR